MDKANYDVFEWLLRQEGLKAADVCRDTGINSATISNWKSGKYVPKNDKINTIAEYFGIEPWAFYGDMDYIQKHVKKDGQYIYDVSAGQGRCNDCFPNDVYSDPPNAEEYSYVRIHGDSMYPELRDGDVVVVHYQTETEPDDYTVVKIDGEKETIKMVEIVKDGVWLRAINKDVYPDKFYSVQDVMTLPITVIGKAVEIRRPL